MSVFSYQSRDASGKIFAGQIEAVSKQAAVQQLRGKGLWITQLTVMQEKVTTQKFFWQTRWRFHSLPRQRLVLFYRQVSVLLSAGLPIHEALQAMRNTQENDSYQQMLQALEQHLLSGTSLAQAMEKLPCFSPVAIQLVRAGEMGGSLEEIFVSLADYEENLYRTQEKMKSLLLYPLILLFTTLCAFVFMTIFILPTFANMLLNLQTELPLPTKVLLLFADVWREHMGLLGLSFLLLSAGIIIFSRYPATKLRWDQWRLSLPILGTLEKAANWLLILRTFAVLLANGLPVHQALAFAVKVTNNLYLQQKLLDVQKSLEAGKSLSTAFAQIKIFPQILQELLQAGEYAGELEKMVRKAVDFCALRLEQQTKRLEAMTEPAALFLVGGLIFFFVLSIVLPLLGAMDVLG